MSTIYLPELVRFGSWWRGQVCQCELGLGVGKQNCHFYVSRVTGKGVEKATQKKCHLHRLAWPVKSKMTSGLDWFVLAALRRQSAGFGLGSGKGSKATEVEREEKSCSLEGSPVAAVADIRSRFSCSSTAHESGCRRWTWQLPAAEDEGRLGWQPKQQPQLDQ